ncbi:hypothetical protein VNI00_008809 [Paramarasmius palmivorus]|uniref:Uncharacterized protein n=1 Tax=Paramarasmius palmivorus TaxID=297713 RepID=A0AAW0CTB8_9AGAR
MNFVDEEPAGYNDHVVLDLASRHIAKRPREESNDDRAEEHGSKRAKFDIEGLWSVDVGQLLANDALSYLLFDTASPVPSTSYNQIFVEVRVKNPEWMFIQAAKDYAANHSKQYREASEEDHFARGFEGSILVWFTFRQRCTSHGSQDPIQLVYEWLVAFSKRIHGTSALKLGVINIHVEDGNTYGCLIDTTSTLAWISAAYEHGRQIANPPHNMWVRGTMELAEGLKWVLLIRSLSRKVTPSYRELIHVLDKLCKRFSRGFQALDEANLAPRRDIEIMQGSDGQPFDCATLGGHVTYANLLAVFDSFLDDQNDPSPTG